MSLSNKAIKLNHEGLTWFYYEKNVKEFIKELKHGLKDWSGAEHDITCDIVDRLAGEKLVEGSKA